MKSRRRPRAADLQRHQRVPDSGSTRKAVPLPPLKALLAAALAASSIFAVPATATAAPPPSPSEPRADVALPPPANPNADHSGAYTYYYARANNCSYYYACTKCDSYYYYCPPHQAPYTYYSLSAD